MSGVAIDWFDTGWTLDEDYNPEVTRFLDTDEALTAGWVGTPYESTAIIYRCTPDGCDVLFEEPGKILGLDGFGDTVWALHAKGAPAVYSLLLSTNGGDDWLDAGAVDINTRCRLLAVSNKEVWLLGLNTFLKTTDRGKSWVKLEAPGERSALKERLSIEGERIILLSSGAAYSTGDGGETWKVVDLEGGRACAVAATALLVRDQENAIHLGAVTPKGMQWMGSFGHAMEPFRLVLDGDAMRFLAMPAAPEENPGMFFFQTTDRGGNWEPILLPCRVIEGAADLGPEGSGYAIGHGGLVYIARPRED